MLDAGVSCAFLCIAEVLAASSLEFTPLRASLSVYFYLGFYAWGWENVLINQLSKNWGA
jgi:hypothetical protein